MRNQCKGYFFSFFFLAVLLMGLLGTRGVHAQTHTPHTSLQRASSLTCGTWSVVPSPNKGPINNELLGVAAVSANNIWAVGYYEKGITRAYQTLIEHWNGTSWSIVTSPNVGTSSNELTSVVAVSANNIWAVGYYYIKSSRIYQTLIEHWNGTSWSVVSSPNVGTGSNELLGVAAVSANNIWAVGEYTNSLGTYQTLTEHWNGTSWSVVSSPSADSGSNELTSIAAVSANNLWAVGDYNNSSNGAFETLTEHWNGTSWSVVSSPSPSSSLNALSSVVAVSANNLWTVGNYLNSSNAIQTLIEQWNGTSWSVVPSPNAGSSDNELLGVAAVSASNLWAVGYYSGALAYQTLIEQWNGTSWSVVPSPNAGSSDNYLYSVAQVPGSSNLWAVGYYNNSNNIPQTLIEFYC